MQKGFYFTGTDDDHKKIVRKTSQSLDIEMIKMCILPIYSLQISCSSILKTASLSHSESDFSLLFA